MNVESPFLCYFFVDHICIAPCCDGNTREKFQNIIEMEMNREDEWDEV